jgi:peptidoglycan hydrolase-like protein with peptidoglycan-binding domain
MRLLKRLTAFTLVLLLVGVLQASALAGYATLELNDTGSGVKTMQAALVTLGYLTGTADGKFGPKTLAAVKSFQKENGLTADGKAGNQTLTALYALAKNGGSKPSGSETTGTSTGTTASGSLVYGSSGSAVKTMQIALTSLGYSTGGTDGKFGNATLQAVKAFQKANKLKVDGKAGTSTLNKLYALAGSGSTGGSSTTSPDAGSAPATYTTLRSGSKGSAVKALQTKLASLDYSVKVTSTYDSQTVKAVKSFQMRNNLTADGVAGVKTQAALYSDSAVKYSAGQTATQSGKYDVPSVGQIKLLHWFNDVKPALKGKSSIYVYDPASGYSFTLHLYSLGRHADVEPLTSQDTANMIAAFGGKITWNPKFVYVRLPNGVWTVATMHDVAHGGQSIKDNDFDGQNCVHFLRDMDEVTKNDPKYGVDNQKALRKGWQALTGEVVE